MTDMKINTCLVVRHMEMEFGCLIGVRVIMSLKYGSQCSHLPLTNLCTTVIAVARNPHLHPTLTFTCTDSANKRTQTSTQLEPVSSHRNQGRARHSKISVIKAAGPSLGKLWLAVA